MPDRGLPVGEQFADDGDDLVAVLQRGELLAGRPVPGAARSCRSMSPRRRGDDVGDRSDVEAGARAGVAGHAHLVHRDEQASPSQSSAAERTYWALPEVSPLRQYSRRDRDQNVTRPVVIVRRNASASIQASMRTSPVSHCWMIAGISPSASNFASASAVTPSIVSYLTVKPALPSACFTSPTVNSPLWNTDAAEHGVRTGRHRGGEVRSAPAPPEAMTGTVLSCRIAADQFQVESVLGAVGVDGVDQQLADAAVDRLRGPGERIQLGLDASAVGGDDEPDPPAFALNVQREHEHLRAEPCGDLADQVGPGDGGAVHAHLVGAAGEQPRHVVGRAHAPADGERDEDLLGGSGDHVVGRGALVDGGGHVEEGDLVRALFVVAAGEFDRVTGIAEVEEVDPLTTRPAATSRHGMTLTATSMSDPGGVDGADQDGARPQFVERVHDGVRFRARDHHPHGHPAGVVQRGDGGRFQPGVMADALSSSATGRS